MTKTTDGGQALTQRSLAEGLGLHAEQNSFTIFRDQVTGLEYIRDSQQLREQGMYVELNAYQRHVFLDFREVHDGNGAYARLAAFLNGRGVPSISGALDQLLLQPIHEPFRALVNADHLRWLLNTAQDDEADMTVLLDKVEQHYVQLLEAARQFGGGSADVQPIAQLVRADVQRALRLFNDTAMDPRSMPLPPESDVVVPDLLATNVIEHTLPLPITPVGDVADVLISASADDATRARLLIALMVGALGKVCGAQMRSAVGYEAQSRTWIDEWQLGGAITDALRGLGQDDSAAAQSLALIKTLTTHQLWYAAKPITARGVLNTLLADADVQQFLRINRYREVLWFHQESLDALLDGLMWLAQNGRGELTPQSAGQLAGDQRIIDAIHLAAQRSEYQVEKLLAAC